MAIQYRIKQCPSVLEDTVTLFNAMGYDNWELILFVNDIAYFKLSTIPFSYKIIPLPQFNVETFLNSVSGTLVTLIAVNNTTAILKYIPIT
jgi:hypothetical protein